MGRARTAWLLAPWLVGACAGNPARYTLAHLHDVEPDVTEVQIEKGLDQAMLAYRKYLDHYTEVSRLQIAGGYIYARSDNELVCASLMAKP